MERFRKWVERYLGAWESNDPADIESLFGENALYCTTPYRETWRGKRAISEGWLERQDRPGTWNFEYEVIAVEGDLGVIRGTTRYDDPDPDYVNLWLVRLDDKDACTEFIEYWMEIDR